MAGGAEVADIDIFREKACGDELRVVGFAQIEMDVFGGWLVAGGLHVEPLEWIGFFTGAGFIEVVGGIGELHCEFGDEVGGDFVATRTDGRADGSEEIFGIAAVFESHAANRFLGDTAESAPPAGMNGGDRAFFRIDEENGHAIGGLDGKEQAGLICSGSVTFANI